MKLNSRAVKYILLCAALSGSATTILAVPGEEAKIVKEDTVKVLINDKFNNDNHGWKITSPGWKVANGEFVKMGNEQTSAAFKGEKYWRDCIIEFDMTCMDFGGGGVSCLFRASDSQNGYLLYMTANGLTVQAKNYAMQGGGQKDIAHYSKKLDVNKKYHIKIRLVGNQIAVYFENMQEPVIIIEDKLCNKGKIGFEAWKSKAKIDNVYVTWNPDDKPLQNNTTTPKPDINTVEGKLEVIKAKYNELGLMLEKYNNQEMKPREIIATHETAEIFMEIMQKDYKKGYEALAKREGDQTIEILDNAINRMKKGDFYLSKQPSVRGVKQKDGYFANGQGEPLFLRNINFFEGNMADINEKDGINRLHNIGFNLLGGYFTHMGSVIDQDGNPRNYNDQVSKKLNIAYENNLLVDSLWMCHIMPSWMKEKHPEFILEGARHNINYDVDNPELRKYHEAYIKTTMDNIFKNVDKDIVADTLFMMDMSNEPRLECMSVLNFKDFRSQLKKTYPNIQALNNAWETKKILNKEYSSFEDIKNYNEIKTLTNKSARALLDYREYNGERQAGYFEWFTDTVNKYSRGVHFNQYAKFDYTVDVLKQGDYARRSRIDPETINRGLNTFGADMYIKDMPSSKYNLEWIKHNFALDYMKSLDKNKAYVNTEWHSADSGALNEEAIRKGYMTEALRIATYHGMSTSVMWAHIEPEHESWGKNGAVISAQPRAFDEYVRESISVENEMDRVVKFPAVDRKIYVLYSMNSITNQGQEYFDMVSNAYEGMYFNDLNVGIITEDMLLKNNIGDMKLLVIPGADYVSDEAFNKIQQLAQNNISTVIYGDALNHDQYGNKRNESEITKKVWYREKSSAEQIAKDMVWLMKWSGAKKQYSLVDESGKEHPDYIEARFAKQGNTDIGYAINYGNKPQTFTIQNVAKGSNNSFRILKNNKLGDSVTKVTLQPREHITFNMD